MKIGVIDYGAGNLRSVMKALKYIGADCDIVTDANDLKNCVAMILPGVGAFASAVQKLKEKNFFDEIKHQANDGKPLFGICLGMQLLLEKSYEFGETEGLGLISGTVERLDDKNGTLKIPHMGWNSLAVKENATLFQNLPVNPYVYFVHSYYLKAANREDVAATTEYSTLLDVSVEHDNLFGCQFHPEKSGTVGLQILRNFAAIGRGTK